ncbi:MAG: HD domain-containing protein [Erysipelotrichaceae bacterium]|nr:HD domain-containing protein [Erysipelotrichaceae bacterium]
MNRYENIKNIFYSQIEEHCHGIYKQRAYNHSLAVCSLCQKLALENDLDIELAGVMGLYHDIAQFVNYSSFNHASRSSEMIQKYLNEYNNEEKDIIINAIKHHSDKDKIHDIYDEILKDADVLAQYFNEPDIILKDASQKRLKKYLP